MGLGMPTLPVPSCVCSMRSRLIFWCWVSGVLVFVDCDCLICLFFAPFYRLALVTLCSLVGALLSGEYHAVDNPSYAVCVRLKIPCLPNSANWVGGGSACRSSLLHFTVGLFLISLVLVFLTGSPHAGFIYCF